MAREQGSTFNDSVHGSITLPALCVRIIDTLEFQRMRNLKQLGLAYLVYPGASHNRFEHSLGVCHLAGRMVDQLNHNDNPEGNPGVEKLISEKEKLCVQIAGLCHDMGHGPFSHAWEGFLRDKAKLSEQTDNNSNTLSWEHEKSSVAMFKHMIESNNLKEEFQKKKLGDDEIEFITTLIEGKQGSGQKPFLYEIISNGLNGVDVDKWDYFLRDSKYLHLRQSFDHERLLTTCRVLEVEGDDPEEGNKHIAYRDKDLANVWDMFQVRAQLHSKAYQHPVVKILEQMWTDALIAADEAGYTISSPEDSRKVSLSKVQDNPKVWKYVTDNIFYEILRNGERLSTGKLRFAEAQDILHRILKRDLYYPIARVDVKDPSKEKVESKSKEIEKMLQESSLPVNEYCLRYLQFDMGKMKGSPSTAFKNFFFYAKNGVKAKSENISKGAVFIVEATTLNRQVIMVLSKKGGRKRSADSGKLTEEEEKCAKVIKTIEASDQ